MDRIPIPRRGWVLVCDGAKALLLQNEGDSELLNLKVVDTLEQQVPAAHDLGTDRPGRVHQSVGDTRSAVETTDYHEEAEEAFLGKVMNEVESLLHERQARFLAIIAPPRALGVIRARITPYIRSILKQELGRDLVQIPVTQIERHLSGG